MSQAGKKSGCDDTHIIETSELFLKAGLDSSDPTLQCTLTLAGLALQSGSSAVMAQALRDIKRLAAKPAEN